MVKIFFLSALFSFAILTAAAQKNKIPVSSDEAQIKSLEKPMLNAAYVIDTTAIANLFDETFIAVEPESTNDKRESFKDYYLSIKQRKDTGILLDSFRVKFFNISIYNNTAVSIFISMKH